MTNAPPSLSRARLTELLDRFPQLKIGLLGDLFLDRYYNINPDAKELSIETGLEAYQIPDVANQPGALGTVMNNLAALGVGELSPVTVIGDDGHGFDLVKSLESLPVDGQGIVRRSERLTPTYTKPVRRTAAGVEEMNRLDIRTCAPLKHEASRLVASQLERLFQEADGIIVLDQINETDWGVVNAEVRDALHQLCRKHPEKLTFVDSRAHLFEFSCGILKGNEAELRAVCGDEENIEAAMRRIYDTTGWPVYCTQGEAGILVQSGPDEPVSAPGYPVDGPVDIVGAGDSATSGIVASLLVGASPVEAAMVGNLVASVTVQKLGDTGTATPAEVLARFDATL